jgi:5-methylcytosine-specific restriction endonuclease McrA
VLRVIVYLVRKDKQMSYNKERYQMKRQLIIDRKKDGCERCGFQAEDPCQLDLDHINPLSKRVSQSGKRIKPSSMMSYSVEAILEELAKCRVLCKNCHSLHTHQTRDERIQMGLAA